MRRTLFALAAVLATFAAHAAQPTTVILVRHAEKTAVENDPPLTEAGEARAKNLAKMLAKSGITTIYTTPYTRTRTTAAPVAATLNLTPIEVPTGPTFAADMAAKLRALPAGSTALVVGHSNSTPAVAKALGIANAPSIDDATEFDKIFIVTLTDEPKLVVLTY
jgi:phosphohistidine phosphatase SixA